MKLHLFYGEIYLYKKLKDKKIKILLGLILIITLNFIAIPSFQTPILNSESDLSKIRSSGIYYDIEINDLPGSLTNWSWATTQPWFGGGSGTELDPYIIEDETFMYSSGAGEPFRVFNSREHFVVRNCTIINSDSNWAGVHLNNVSNGDFLDNQIVFNGYGIVYIDVNNSLISNNNISTYSDYGIWLIDNCDNNTINGNTVNGNGGTFGIVLELDADVNLIYENYVTNNALDNAIDDGTNNNWNNTVIGNYWDDYTGYDMDLDGIGDDPYNISGNFDFLPIWNLQGPISIDDLPGSLNNWTWAMNQAWCSGSGTELDPFIIEALTIDANGTGNCISIENSRKYFIIQGCLLNGSGISLTDAGLYLSNVTNAFVTNNSFTNNYNGIYFENSYDNEILSNNVVDNFYVGIWGQYSNNYTTISDNSITNSQWGIAIDDGNNDVIRNNVITNSFIHDGILFYGSGYDCVIDNNYIESSNDDGIDLQSFSNCIIYNNTIINNIGFGLYLGDVNNTLVYENYFINNTIQATDDGTNNNWNNSMIGNYWDDYLGYDMNLDGIGDTPYNIPGSAGAFDYLPIWNIQAPIAINDLPGSLNNWTWAASQAWCSGSGIELDPYIIENMNIDANLTDSCISILNSEALFIIRGCNLNNSSSSGSDGGIYLNNVTNGNIMDNNFDNSRNAAIYGTMSSNNTILGNALNNGRHGIYIIGSYNEILNNEIYGDGTGTGIVIEGSYTSNKMNGNIIENCWQGIWISGVDNNTLLGNEVSNNLQNGIILLADSNFNYFSGNIVENNALNGFYIISGDDNTIHNNVIRNNFLDGINIATGSVSNLIYRNFFWGNGRHAYDDGAFTAWNSTTIGNYWDNHTGPDTSPNDGIVDTPYTFIEGSAGSIDYLPIAEDGPPIIIIITPFEDDVFGTSAPSFSVNITDTFLDDMWYTLDGGLHNYTFTGSTGTVNQSAWDALPDGTITLTFYASDYADNIGSAEVTIEKDSLLPPENLLIIIIIVSIIFGVAIVVAVVFIVRRKRKV